MFEDQAEDFKIIAGGSPRAHGETAIQDSFGPRISTHILFNPCIGQLSAVSIKV